MVAIHYVNPAASFSHSQALWVKMLESILTKHKGKLAGRNWLLVYSMNNHNVVTMPNKCLLVNNSLIGKVYSLSRGGRD